MRASPPPNLLDPGSRRLAAGSPPEPPAPLVPPPPSVPDVCWDHVQHITAGFSTAQAWQEATGVRRHIRAIVWHDMEGYLPGAIERWNTGVAGAHLCILRDGTVVLTCDLRHVAWHAGTSHVPGSDTYGRTPFWRRTNINGYSIGVELEGFCATGYTPAQAAACRRVSDWLTARYGILREHTFDQIDGHHSHSELSAMRGDPGPLFDWRWVL